MIVPIKQIILEFVGPMTAVKQNHNNNLTKNRLPTPKPVEGNGAAMDARNKSLEKYKPSNNIVADNLKEASKKSGFPGGN